GVPGRSQSTVIVWPSATPSPVMAMVYVPSARPDRVTVAESPTATVRAVVEPSRGSVTTKAMGSVPPTLARVTSTSPSKSTQTGSTSTSGMPGTSHAIVSVWSSGTPSAVTAMVTVPSGNPTSVTVVVAPGATERFVTDPVRGSVTAKAMGWLPAVLASVRVTSPLPEVQTEPAETC